MRLPKKVTTQLSRIPYLMLPVVFYTVSMHAGELIHVIFSLGCVLILVLLYFADIVITTLFSFIKQILERIEKLEQLIEQQETGYEKKLETQDSKTFFTIFTLLTERQKEVTALLIRGYTYHEMVEELKVSINTIRSHVSAVYEKCNVKNRKELVVLVREEIKAGNPLFPVEEFGKV